MPDVSNEDLMKLMYRLLKKVDTIEEKLNLLLGDELMNRENETVEIVKDIPKFFNYDPINNDKELERVSNKILNDERYKKNLRQFMMFKEQIKLEDIFTLEFLKQCNFKGNFGRKKLSSFVPYTEIYVYLKKKKGFRKEQITKTASDELIRIKNRMRMSNHRQKIKTEKDTTVPENQHEESIIEEIDYEETIEPEVSFVKEKVEEIIVDMESEEHEMENEVYLNEELEEENEDEFESIDDEIENGEEFTPINTELQLKQVSHKINTDPIYLKDLRVKIVQESTEGVCALEQIFTPNFLLEYTMFGTRTTKKLADLVPYQSIYFYLRQHLGFSLTEIEKDAMHELNTLKHRINTRLYRQKLKENQK